MTTWVRIRFDGRSVILRNPSEGVLGGVPTLTGIEVNAQDEEVTGRGAKIDERRHIVALKLISKRTPMVMNKKYATLEPADVEAL